MHKQASASDPPMMLETSTGPPSLERTGTVEQINETKSSTKSSTRPRPRKLSFEEMKEAPGIHGTSMSSSPSAINSSPLCQNYPVMFTCKAPVPVMLRRTVSDPQRTVATLISPTSAQAGAPMLTLAPSPVCRSRCRRSSAPHL